MCCFFNPLYLLSFVAYYISCYARIDIIHYYVLFTLLSFTKIAVKILRHNIDSYDTRRQGAEISWDNVGLYTQYFRLLGGVKQVGMLSAKLFTLFFFTKLKQSGYGCQSDNTYRRVFSYADDIILS